jgi:hypothetical protein
MKNQTILQRESASADHTSEIEYAAFMHYSAAYLPSGSSPSLDLEPEPAGTHATVETTPSYTRHLVIERTPILFAV